MRTNHFIIILFIKTFGMIVFNSGHVP